MPIPRPKKGEQNFMARCMSDEVMKKEYPDTKQRVAICIQQSTANLMEQAAIYYELGEAEYDDEWDEWTQEIELNELYDSESGLEVSLASEYKGRKVKLNKPFRTPDGPKKFAVYVKNDKGKVVIVRFGDPNMEIKKDDPKRRKAFKDRHNCSKKTDRTTPGYWSCKWSW